MARPTAAETAPAVPKAAQKYDVRPGQSRELLHELHILTRDGKLNQDSRRKLKQVYHLFNFIEPLLAEAVSANPRFTLVDHGAGKSYLGFILYDLFCRERAPEARIWGVEARPELVARGRDLAARLGFAGMGFLDQRAAEAVDSPALPAEVEIVTALHACNTATDDAISFALAKKARHVVLVPCCQAEVAAELRKNKAQALADPLAEIWRHPLHTREFGSHLGNVLRCLRLQAKGYEVRVTELTGWEHSLKNELIIATDKRLPGKHAAARLEALLTTFGLTALRERFA